MKFNLKHFILETANCTQSTFNGIDLALTLIRKFSSTPGFVPSVIILFCNIERHISTVYLQKYEGYLQIAFIGSVC